MGKKIFGVVVSAIIVAFCLFCFGACGSAASSVLNENNSEPSNVHKHTPVHFAAEKATCTEDGNVEYWKCSECNKIFSDPDLTDELTDITIPKTGHDYRSEVVSSTCKEKGYTEHTCANCGDSYKDTYTELIEHKWNDGEITLEPKCGAAGERELTCSECGATKTEGVTALEHDYKTTVVPSTCKDKGYTEHACANCGDTYIDAYTELAEHKWNDGEITLEPKCGVAGERELTCSECGATKIESVTALEHDYKTTVVPSTCKDKGYTEHVCSRCGDNYKDAFTELIEHKWDSGVTEVEPSCTGLGEKRFTCEACGATRTEDIGALGHDHVILRVENATCTQGGYTEYKCERCGDVRIGDETDALGHDYTEVVTAPTCIAGGFTLHTCARCGDSFTDGETSPTEHGEDEICYICGHGGCEVIYELNEDGTSYTAVGTDTRTPKTIIVVAEYNGKPVTAIAEGAFNRSTVEFVYIPSSVAFIGKNAISKTNAKLSIVFETDHYWSYSLNSDGSNSEEIETLTTKTYDVKYYWFRKE